MAFGAFRGGGGLVGQKPYGLSSMFLGLSDGLADFAKMRQSSDLEESRLKHEDARTAADRAFQDNLARFHVTAQKELAQQSEDAASARDDKRLAVETSHYSDEKAHQERVDKETADQRAEQVRHNKADEGIQAQTKAELAEQRKQHAAEYKAQSEAAAAAIKRGDAAAADKIAGDMVSGPKATVQAAQASLNAIQKSPSFDPDSQAYKDAQNDLKNAQSDLATAEKAAAPIRAKALKDIGYGDQPAAGAAATNPLATLSPDKQEYAKRAMAADPTMTADKAAAAANAAPPAMIQKALSLPAPVAKPPQASVDQAPGDFAQGDGTAAVPTATGAVETQPETGQTGVVSGGPSQYTTAGPEMTGPPAASPDASGAPPAPTAPDAQPDASAPQPDASATAQAAPAQPDPAAQFEGMAQSLNRTPEGQGVITTLSRLAESKEGPVADKMRRAAEIQLQDQFPDQDANGFIDYYLNENAQEVA